ncbi:MAG: hypothetical protein KBS41_02510 [Oscillospiraceae bacterium]|nr:hypothetical protein [Candidatus Equicaccousia limihippi]
MISSQDLKKEYPIKIEMHCHCKPASGCGDFTAPELVNIYKKEGYDALLLTNHFMYSTLPEKEYCDFWYADFEKAVKEGEKVGLKVMLGAELRFLDTGTYDFSLIGLDRSMLEKTHASLRFSPEYFYNKVKDDRSLLIQVHPFREPCRPYASSALDGMELINGHPRQNNSNTYSARYLAQHPELLRVCGTDFHHPHMQALTALRTKTLPADSFELAEILRSKDYLLQLGENIILPY